MTTFFFFTTPMTTELTVPNAAGKLNVHNESPRQLQKQKEKRGPSYKTPTFDFSQQGNMDLTSQPETFKPLT